MKTKLLNKLSRCTPPGQSLKPEWRALTGGLFLAVLWSLRFFFAYSDALGELYDQRTGSLIPGALMPPFPQLLSQYNSAAGFPILALIMLCFCPYHYGYFYQGSRSIYIMGRLKSPWELHLRCLTVPVLGAVAALLTGLVLSGLYFCVYILFTPAGCLP